MRASDYAKAVYEVIEAGTDVQKALENLYRTLERRGHQKLKRAILTNLIRYTEEATKKNTPSLILARSGDAEKLKKEITAALGELSAEGEPLIEVRDAQIGGFTLTHKGKRIDRSYKTALLQLYKNITS